MDWKYDNSNSKEADSANLIRFDAIVSIELNSDSTVIKDVWPLLYIL